MEAESTDIVSSIFYILRSQKPTTTQMFTATPFSLQICKHESLNTDMSTLMALCKKSSSDIRSCLNTLQVNTLPVDGYAVCNMHGKGYENIHSPLNRCLSHLYLFFMASNMLLPGYVSALFFFQFFFLFTYSNENAAYDLILS